MDCAEAIWDECMQNQGRGCIGGNEKVLEKNREVGPKCIVVE